MSPEQRRLLAELDRAEREIGTARSYPADHPERVGITIADLDWNAEKVLIQRELRDQ